MKKLTNEEFIEKAQKIQQSNPEIKFLLQTDENDFRTMFLKVFPDSIVIEELNCTDRTFEHSVNLLSAVHIISKSKYIICSSGNVSFWMCLYRGNADNVQQYLHHIHEDKSTKRDWWL
jgi:hypothetical protein